MAKEARQNQWGRFPLHRDFRDSTTKKPPNLQETVTKIVAIFYQVRKIG
jgi:hypothetical protein